MTSYTAIPNGDIDQDSPITQPLMTALRDNPIAIAEGDASVPASLFPTVLLGTITTTSGTTQTLSGLDLTPYRFIIAVINGVSGSVNSFTITIGGADIGATTPQNSSQTGMAFFDLGIGVAFSVTGRITDTSLGGTTGDDGSGSRGNTHTITTASTSISVVLSGGTAFDAGSIRIYGVK
jgi:hypothetical protein